MEKQEMSPGEWAVTIFITKLPVIGFILLLVWALGDDTNVVRKNYAKGALILQLIIIASLIGFFVLGGLALFGVDF